MGRMALQFQAPVPEVTSDSELYSPPSFPPPINFTLSLTSDGKQLSTYGDDYWDFSGWDRSRNFNFRRQNLSSENLNLAKQAMFFVMYHPRLFPGTLESCKPYFLTLVKVAKVCDEQRILISNLHRFPRVFTLIADALLEGSKGVSSIACLHKLNMWGDDLGFGIGNEQLLLLLRKRAKKHQHVQHPYIPPRIWAYQIQRLSEVLDDFVQHQNAIERAFDCLANACLHNRKVASSRYQSPFSPGPKHDSRRIVFKGGFGDFLERHGLLGLFQRWIGGSLYTKQGSYRLQAFTRYLTFVRDVSLIYIINFSLQRVSEVSSLRSNCFHVEKDPNLGVVCYLSGETTKTVRDSNARWIVPEGIKKAVDVAAKVANLRLSVFPEAVSLSEEDRVNPRLLFPVTEPWGGEMPKIRAEAERYGRVVLDRKLSFSRIADPDFKLFDDEIIQLTEEDAHLALSLTPNLNEKEWFGVGKPWHFSAHQLRRTLAVNMFASNVVSTSSIQHQMKHLSRAMTLYYGRHHTNLFLNTEAEKVLIMESYDSAYRTLVDVVENQEENVRPHGKIPWFDSVVDLIEAGEERRLMKLIRSGGVGIRKTALGFCMKEEHCEYGGIESISKCGGGDGGGICSDAIFATKNRDRLLRLQKSHKEKIEQEPDKSMRVGSLRQEIYAIEVYLNVIERDR